MEKNREIDRTAGKERNPADRGREGQSDRNGRKADSKGKLRKFFFPLVVLLAVLAAVFAVCMVKSGGGKGKGPGTWGGSVRVETGAGKTEGNGENPLHNRNIYFSGVEDAVIGINRSIFFTCLA